MVSLILKNHNVRAYPCQLLFPSIRRRLCLTASFYERKPSYWHNPGTEPLVPLTTGQLVDIAADRWGQREALVSVHQNHRLTFQDVRQQADRLAAGLLGLGLKPGDRLGLWGPNSSQWYLTFIAAARAGLILVNINPAYQTSEVHYCLTKVGVKALIAPETFLTQNYYEMMKNISPDLEMQDPEQLQCKALPELKSMIIFSENKLRGALRFSDVMDKATPESLSEVHKLQNILQPDEGINLQFTSGTTGTSKATLLSHHSTINNMLCFGKRLQLFSKEHRICLQVPFFHCFGNVLGVLAALCYGATLVLPGPKFNSEESVIAIEKERCTVIYGTPTMYVDNISKAKDANNKLDTLEFAVVAGAPCSKELVEQLQRTFGLKIVYGGYGMTETSPLSFMTLPTDSDEKVTSTIGHIMDHVEAKVVDEDGKMVPFGNPGELWVRGYLNMLEYWGEDDRTKETIGTDRWLKTGDQFILREDGYGQVVGRIKDMIIRGGENIFPKEIEHFLEQHDDIVEAQVIGIPDTKMGEEVCACLRLKEGSTITTDQVKDFCKGKIAHFKIPRYIHFLTEFPKTQSGKIQKFQLRKMISQGR